MQQYGSSASATNIRPGERRIDLSQTVSLLAIIRACGYDELTLILAPAVIDFSSIHHRSQMTAATAPQPCRRKRSREVECHPLTRFSLSPEAAAVSALRSPVRQPPRAGPSA